MLRIIQNSTAEGAKSYYSSADYYSEGQELEGQWRGLAAERLGVCGVVEKGAWDALCDNKHPQSGERLTARQKANRRVGYDINFHVPKSVSVLFGLTEDARILSAFKEAVDETMRQMEAEVKTRVRGQGRDEDRVTGNLAWGEFVHFTARPVGGVPDPHLHAHCFAFNVTWDAEEERWKAAQFAGLKRSAPYYEAAFHARLAKTLTERGFGVERSGKGWELAGVPESAVRAFSRRTALIEARASERGITNAAEKAELGAKTRARKSQSLTMDELRSEWWARLSPEERDAIGRIGAVDATRDAEEERVAARRAVEFALKHCLERSAVVSERALLAAALKHAYGAASLDAVQAQLEEADVLTAWKNGQRLVTTKPVLGEEQAMLAFARDGRGACARLTSGEHPFSRDWLSAGQRRAVEHVLGSRDRVTLIRGGAGTGKTSMMQEAVEGLEAQGHRVLVFAPSAEASRGVLRSEGFAQAETVARLLLDERLQAKARGQVIWVDEAGLLGSRTMARLFETARQLDARVILSGDQRQHGSVERGSALALLEDEAGLEPAEIKEIQRQRGAYKEAVQLLSEERTAAGFKKLDELGWVKEVAGEDRDKLLAQDCLEAVLHGRTALVVSPTHREGERITHEVRGALKEAGRLDEHEHSVLTLENRNLTEAERAEPRSYRTDDQLVFHQNAKGFVRGQRLAANAESAPVSEAARFQVFRSGSMSVAAGDVLRITRNGKTMDGKHRLNNGQLVTVGGFTNSGNLVLVNGWTVAKDYGHLAYGYVVTSYASQGKTVDQVLIGQSTDSEAASSREQFYVSVSRGRRQATIYTDDKEAMLEAVSRSSDRMSATELVRERTAHLARTAIMASAAPVYAAEHREMAHVR